MAKVEHGVVRGPNQTSPGCRDNSSGPMSRGPSSVHAPNNGNKTPRVNSCGPMGRSGSPMPRPDAGHRFDVADADAGYRDVVAAPGAGAVPTDPAQRNPFGPQFVPAHMLKSDTAKR